MSEFLTQSAARIKTWTVESALPLWADRARLPDGSWVEHLALSGAPDVAAERRWRVLARQVYVYAQASRYEWYDGAAIAEQTYSRMQATGYVHRVDMGGYITDGQNDFYDHAFYLLAAASLYGLTHRAQYLRDAEAVLAWINDRLKHPSGGWYEGRSADGKLIHGTRRQNPHMHLLEASMFLHSLTKNPDHLAPANEVFGLFEAHFFCEDTHTISEFFTRDWKLAAGDIGQTAEPGHAMEWVWLLGQYTKASGIDTTRYRKALYARAIAERDIFLNDEEDASGNIRRETKRLWVQTEVIKAHLAQAECGFKGSADMAAATIDALFGPYLTPLGLWNDQINACSANVAATIPVSTFYHLLCMAVEAERVAELLR